MKEFKFWAIPYSFKQLILFAILIWFVFFAIIYIVDVYKYFLYIWFGVFVWVFICGLLIVRRVRISFSEAADFCIFMNGHLKYEGNIRNLEYVRGTNISNNRGRGTLTFNFSDKKLRFSIFEMTGPLISKDNQQVRLLKYMISTFKLEPEVYQDSYLNQIYTYWNPEYEDKRGRPQYNSTER